MSRSVSLFVGVSGNSHIYYNPFCCSYELHVFLSDARLIHLPLSWHLVVSHLAIYYLDSECSKEYTDELYRELVTPLF